MKNKKLIIIFSTVLAATLIASYFFFGKKSEREVSKIDPAFSQYISAFTSGIISSQSTIRVRLTEEYPEIIVGAEIEDDLFDFEPEIEGKAYWYDNQTIEFRPSKSMKYGQLYEVDFFLDKLIDVESRFETFEFEFQILQQNVSVSFDGISLYDQKQLQWQIINGTLLTSDVVNNVELEKILSATQNNKKLTIQWAHDGNGKIHQFKVDSVARDEEASSLLLTWNGEAIGCEQTGKLPIEVPALGDFKIVQTKVVQQPEQYVSIIFSDPLDNNQSLTGLIKFKNNTKASTTINENEVRLYPSSRQQGLQWINIYPGIKNILGYKTKEQQDLQIRFEDIKPGIEILGKGTIVPNAEGIKFPFKAVNLKAVKVKIIKIFENNVHQFLQVNKMAGQREIKRVGRIVYKEVVTLNSDKPIDYGTWNSFSLDLDKMIKTEPGAIYRVVLSFTKSESMYPCPDEDDNEENMSSTDDDDDGNWDEGEYYDYYGDYYYDDYDYYYYDDYDYSQRDNPCHSTYYRSHTTSVARNILASDLGIIAKIGMDKKLNVAVTDLITTAPLSNVNLEIYNYQNQLISNGETNGEGLAIIDIPTQPYLLVAKQGDQRGYLRLDNGSSLSLSTFDVTGNATQKGIKGFIYGERGVWRPGDSLHLNFILEDKQNLLPDNHPVSFELINPEGKTVNRLTKTKGVGKFYNFSTKTEPEAPTGNWSARVRVGGAVFQKLIKIEAIKPNRLKINLDFGTDRITNLNSDITGKLKVTWLHGAIAKNLKTDIEVTTKQTKTTFEGYKEFNFDDPARSFDSEEQNLFNGRLNQLGEADVQANLRVRDAAPGMLNASFKIKVFEEGGDFSIDRFTIPYAPYLSFVGIKTPEGDKTRGMLFTDEDHTVEIATVDAEGKPVSRNNLKVEVYKVSWRWWWERTSNDDISRYVGNSSKNLISKSFVNTTNGKGTYKLNIKAPDWGRFYVRITDPQSGHSTGKTVYLDWPGWKSRSQKDNPGGASMLMFSTDKDNYKVGDKATVTIPSNDEGRALVSIESGSRVVKAYWVETQKDNTIFDFDITEEMSPNVFVNITLVQPHNSTKNDLPIRMYGVVPISVVDPETKLRPTISMPDELQPEKEVTIKIAEENGKAMNYTIAIVDEGLLDLTRFKTPDAWQHFYAREALGVKTWDLYDEVMGAYAGEIAGLLEIGGDGEIINKEGGDKANRFKPMVKFLGPFKLETGDKGEHTFTMPQYIGSVRTMVIAGKNNAYGFAEETTPVRQPLMVLATLPRVVGPGETVKLPVTVFAMKENIKNVSVEVKSNSLLPVIGSTKKNVTFSEVGDKIVNFDIQVPEKIGIGKVEVIVKSGSNIAKHNIELDVRNPNPTVTNVLDKVIDPNTSWNTTFTMPGMVGTNSATLEISSMPPINLDERLKYLIQYPHGCVEQTTSSAFPQLYLGDLMELPANFTVKIKENITNTINRLQQFQLSDGGFAYWPGRNEANDWGSTYAGHFLLEARAKGYAVPSGMIDNWARYQTRIAQSWTASNTNSRYYYRRDDFIQAYRLFTLALANRADLGAMNRLKEKYDLTLSARWRLAAAYQLAGQPEVAKKLIMGQGYEIEDYQELSYTYGSSDRDRAMILEALTLMGDRETAAKVLKILSNRMSSNRWMSTQTTAYSLLAVAKFMNGNKVKSDFKYTYSYNGGNSSNVLTNSPISQVELDAKKVTNKINVQNTSGSVLFARVISHGVPVTGDQSEKQEDLKLSVKYLDMNNYPLDPTKIPQGTDFKVEVTITNPGYRGHYSEMALSQTFPSGWEIHNTRMDEVGSVHTKDSPEYMDIRDDRVYYYFDLAVGKSKTFVTLLNASYVGKFYLPTINAEAMYDNTINARKPGMWVEVVKE